MKISRAGSSSGWASNHASRLLATSGLSCSLACAVFFECQAAAVEERPDLVDAGARAALGDQPLPDFDDGDVVLLRDATEDRLAMGVELRAFRLPARPGHPRARVPRTAHSDDSGRDTHAEPRRSRARRKRLLQRRVNHPIPQILTVGPRHHPSPRFERERIRQIAIWESRREPDQTENAPAGFRNVRFLPRVTQ